IKSPLLIEHIGDAPVNTVLAALYRLRLRFLASIDSNFSPRLAGTLKATLIGNRYFLDPEVVERLRESSTFHILVISGFHFGIIAWVLMGGRSGLKRSNIKRVIVCLFTLWGYAVMVGFAAPVTRATTMITIGLIGPLIFRRAVSINTVAASAFVMLALKPALVADPGFQLSFIAVAGIVALALPLAEKLRAVGEWRPTAHTPHPPTCAAGIRRFAETLYWDDESFNEEVRHSPVRYRLIKAGAARRLGRLKVQALLRSAVVLAITSAATQLSTLPLMALYFNRVAPVGVLLNVVAGLLTAVLMLGALVTIALSWLSAWAAAKLVLIVNAAHYLLVNAIVPFANIPFATFRVAHYEGWQSIVYALYFVPLALLAVLIDRWQPVDRAAFERAKKDPARKKRAARVILAASPRLGVALPIFCAFAMTSALLAVVSPPSAPADGKLTIHFLDVGQGDAALVVFPTGKTMLVDGGGQLQFYGRRPSVESEESESVYRDTGFSVGDAVVSRFIWSLGRTRVDYILATHAHADHMAGLSDVVGNFRVGQAVVGHQPTSDPEYNHFREAIARRGLLTATVSTGERFELDGVAIEILWPRPPVEAPVTSGNDDSVVLRLVYGSVSILLAGDIERAAEDAIVASGVDLAADLLKVPHHGSKTSSSERFINAVNPRYAVISVGERSRFGHPHASVVERYIARGVTWFQTGRDGMVTAQTDGSTLEITSYKR
ncbi:MAG: ComEC/Rec2 family competence protein, partial [Blastocatellia bacterium]